MVETVVVNVTGGVGSKNTDEARGRGVVAPVGDDVPSAHIVTGIRIRWVDG